jgi:hypothetical protein
VKNVAASRIKTNAAETTLFINTNQPRIKVGIVCNSTNTCA